MNDAALTQIHPPWNEWSKRAKEKIWKEYLALSLVDEHTPAWKELERRHEVLKQEHFLGQLPNMLFNNNSMGLFSLLDRINYDVGYFDTLDPAQGKDFALQVWERAGTAIKIKLDTRDFMMTMSLMRILNPIVERVGRAVRTLQKSEKWASFLTFVFTPTPEHVTNMMSMAPMQHEAYQVFHQTLYTVPKRYLNNIVKCGTLRAMTVSLPSICPSVLPAMGPCMENVSRASYDHYLSDNHVVDDDTTTTDHMMTSRLIQGYFTKISQAACQRLLATNVNLVSMRGVEVSDIVGPLCGLLQTIAMDMHIPIPMSVRRHVQPFGDKYTIAEPRDPVERSKWSQYYVAMRVCEEDWTTADPTELRQAYKDKWGMMEARRGNDSDDNDVRCASCHAQGDNLSKCSHCKQVYYCGRRCQIKDWKTHKQVCKKVSRKSVPERLLSLQESFDHSYAHMTKGGHTEYPLLFAIWLDWKYNESPVCNVE